MASDEITPEQHKILKELVGRYFRGLLSRDFSLCTDLLYPGDLDKFRNSFLWCANAMAPFGETQKFLSLFGSDLEVEDIEVLDPREFLEKYLSGVFGTSPFDEWEKIVDSISVNGIAMKEGDVAEVSYSYTVIHSGKPNHVERNMYFQRIGERWFGLLEKGLTMVVDNVRGDIGDFHRREKHDTADDIDADPYLELFTIHGYKDDRNGKTVIEPRFSKAEDFSEGLAAVRFFRRWGFINANGETIIAPNFDRASSFSEGLAAVAIECIKTDSLTWGYIDADGTEVIPLQYDAAEKFSEGLAAVEKDTLWGFIDRNGQLLIPHQFSSTAPFEDGAAEVEIHSDEGIRYLSIDRNGNTSEYPF